MDWDKKTAQRPPLLQATADVFNDTKTPGQQLLAGLQTSETVRKQRYYGTVDAKMKAAREQLPALSARNPQKSDQTIFSLKPAAEVAALLPDITPKKVNMEHVQAMMGGQMRRHSVALDRFVSARDAELQTLQFAVAMAASKVQRQLAEQDRGADEDMAVLADDHVMRLTEQEVYQVSWEQLHAEECEHAPHACMRHRTRPRLQARAFNQ